MQAAPPPHGGGHGGAPLPPLRRLPASLLGLVAARLTRQDLEHFRLACRATREAAALTRLSVRAQGRRRALARRRPPRWPSAL
jgi:hypothetical protein